MSLLGTVIEHLPLQPQQQVLAAGVAGFFMALIVAVWINARVRPSRHRRRREVLVPPPL